MYLDVLLYPFTFMMYRVPPNAPPVAPPGGNQAERLLKGLGTSRDRREAMVPQATVRLYYELVVGWRPQSRLA
jgi:hypothetical protein